MLHLNLRLNTFDTVLLNNLLVAAKLLIARYRKSEDDPTLNEWQLKYQYLLSMNKVSAMKVLIMRVRLAMYSFVKICSRLLGVGWTKERCSAWYLGNA